MNQRDSQLNRPSSTLGKFLNVRESISLPQITNRYTLRSTAILFARRALSQATTIGDGQRVSGAPQCVKTTIIPVIFGRNARPYAMLQLVPTARENPSFLDVISPRQLSSFIQRGKRAMYAFAGHDAVAGAPGMQAVDHLNN
jgi:hypothetical protein